MVNHTGIPATSNHSHGGAVAYNHSHGFVAANHSGGVGALNESVCPAFPATSMWHIPLLCDEVLVGSTHWQSVICYPTWDYRAMELAVFFTGLFWLRLYARREIHTLQKQRHVEAEAASRRGSSEDLSTSETCCMGAPQLRTPLMKAGASRRTVAAAGDNSPESPKSTSGRCLRRMSFCVMNLLRRASALTYDIVKRTLLQILQWWVVMIAMMLLLAVDSLWNLHAFYGIDVVLISDGKWWRVVTPDEFDAIPHWLVTFSIYSFVALAVVYVFSLLSIVLQIITHCSVQVLRCNMFAAGSAMVTLPRDVAIQVLLLPMVYSILAAKNVTIMWSNMTGHYPPATSCFGRSDKEKEALMLEDFESNFALADMYEAWALYCFGQMVAKVLQPDLRKKIRLDVVKAFESLLLIDVSVFVLVCAVGADYVIALTWCKWRLGVDICDKFPFVCSFRPYLVGANWCSSSIAIYNLFTVEHKFGLLNTMIMFGPNLKFWSIKIMVLVAFWMNLVIVIVRDVWHLTQQQSQLLDASFRIYVMAIVSIINLKAWWPWSAWYRNVDAEEIFRLSSRLSFTEKSTPLTEVGVKHVPPGTVALVQQLFGMSPKEATVWSHVEATIKELSEADLDRVLHHGSQIGWAVSGCVECVHGKARHRKAMMDLSLQERRDALMEHLQGFYPEV